MSVVLGLPKKMLPSPEASLSEGCTASWVKIQPNNIASVVSNTYNGMTASTVATNIPMVSQEVRFSVPCGQGKNVWLDTSKTSLSFRARYEITAVSVGSATISGGLQGSAMNFFDRLQVINSNGVPIDDVVGLRQIETHKQAWTFDSAERDSVAMLYGFRAEDAGTSSQNILGGHDIPIFTTATTLDISSNYFSYDMPLPSSFLGNGAKGFVPIGALQKLDCYLTTASVLPINISVGSGLTTSATVKITLDNFSINAYYITLDDKSASLLGSPKIHYLHGITNRQSNATINSGTTGQLSTLIGIRGQSVRSLATRFSTNVFTSAGCINGVLDSKMPIASQLNYFLQGKDRVPPNPHSTATAVSTVFLHALQSSEAFNEREFRFGGTPSAYAKYLETSTAPTSADGYDMWLVNAGSTSSATTLTSFCFGEDLRKASTSAILDGYNMASSANNYLEMNLLKAPTNTVYASFIASMDIIYLIDMETGSVEFRV
jgi:hypothetical protein